jgi:hypothetical protein
LVISGELARLRVRNHHGFVLEERSMFDLILPSQEDADRVAKIREDLEAILELQERIELPSQAELDRVSDIRNTVKSLSD